MILEIVVLSIFGPFVLAFIVLGMYEMWNGSALAYRLSRWKEEREEKKSWEKTKEYIKSL